MNMAQINARELLNILMLQAVASDDVFRQSLSMIHVKDCDGRVMAVATNGHAMTAIPVNFPLTELGIEQLQIATPIDTVVINKLKRLAKNHAAFVEVSIDDAYFRIKQEDFVYHLKMSDKEFPRITPFLDGMKKEKPHKISFNVGFFNDCIKSIGNPEKVTFEFIDSLAPIHLKATTDTETKCLLMPLKV